MRVREARVDWALAYINRPSFQVLTDRLPLTYSDENVIGASVTEDRITYWRGFTFMSGALSWWNALYATELAGVVLFAVREFNPLDTDRSPKGPLSPQPQGDNMKDGAFVRTWLHHNHASLVIGTPFGLKESACGLLDAASAVPLYVAGEQTSVGSIVRDDIRNDLPSRDEANALALCALKAEQARDEERRANREAVKQLNELLVECAKAWRDEDAKLGKLLEDYMPEDDDDGEG